MIPKQSIGRHAGSAGLFSFVADLALLRALSEGFCAWLVSEIFAREEGQDPRSRMESQKGDWIIQLYWNLHRNVQSKAGSGDLSQPDLWEKDERAQWILDHQLFDGLDPKQEFEK